MMGTLNTLNRIKSAFSHDIRVCVSFCFWMVFPFVLFKFLQKASSWRVILLVVLCASIFKGSCFLVVNKIPGIRLCNLALLLLSVRNIYILGYFPESFPSLTTSWCGQYCFTDQDCIRPYKECHFCSSASQCLAAGLSMPCSWPLNALQLASQCLAAGLSMPCSWPLMPCSWPLNALQLAYQCLAACL